MSGWGEALDRVAGSLREASPERVAVLGGARLTSEAQYMWAKLAKGVIGTDNVDAQLGDGLDPAVSPRPAQSHHRRGPAGRAAPSC